MGFEPLSIESVSKSLTIKLASLFLQGQISTVHKASGFGASSSPFLDSNDASDRQKKGLPAFKLGVECCKETDTVSQNAIIQDSTRQERTLPQPYWVKDKALKVSNNHQNLPLAKAKAIKNAGMTCQNIFVAASHLEIKKKTWHWKQICNQMWRETICEVVTGNCCQMEVVTMFMIRRLLSSRNNYRWCWF